MIPLSIKQSYIIVRRKRKPPKDFRGFSRDMIKITFF
jgi:hypothetical protein